MIFKVEILDEAIDDIEAAVDYIAKDSVPNALNWHDRITTAIQTLDEMPERCPIADENPYFTFEVRCLLVDGYRVLYRIKEGTVEVLHVKHPRQDHV